jgi:hypothetical protein
MIRTEKENMWRSDEEFAVGFCRIGSAGDDRSMLMAMNPTREKRRVRYLADRG